MFNLEIARHLVSAFENDSDDPDRIGFCGTSIQALELMLEEEGSGILPAASITLDLINSKDPPKGRLSFYPIRETFTDHRSSSRFKPGREAYQAAADFAQTVARVDSLLATFNIPITDFAARNRAIIMMGGFVNPEARSYQTALAEFIASNPATTMGQLLDARNYAMEKAKGVILGIDRRITGYYKAGIPQGDEPSELTIPKGLDYKLISSADPRGDLEYEFFINLQDMPTS